jgi:hypothetical protein
MYQEFEIEGLTNSIHHARSKNHGIFISNFQIKYDSHLSHRRLTLISKILLASVKKRKGNHAPSPILHDKGKENEDSLLTSAGTRSSEKNEEDDSVSGPNGRLSTTPEAITMCAETFHFFACNNRFFTSITGGY